MIRKIVLFACVWLAACGRADSPTQSPDRAAFRGSVLSQALSVADFSLHDQYGQPFVLSEQRGKVLLLFFGYTSCPDVCPTTLGEWKQVHARLGADAARVRFVFITVDPERDTPARLQQHLALFNADFIGLTGSRQELEPVYQAFGVYYEKVEAPESALGYLVNHTSSGYVLDTQGVWRLRHSFGTPIDDIVYDIRLLLAEEQGE